VIDHAGRLDAAVVERLGDPLWSDSGDTGHWTSGIQTAVAEVEAGFD
jgi:hypothetical protein